MNSARLMVQGTTSDAGKSLLVTALCRWLVRQNISVLPFKPQNMALNSAVTEDGGEIGRAQALQALAAKQPALVDMNPVLLKPHSDVGAQVIIQGRSAGNMDAQNFQHYKKIARQAVLESFNRLSSKAQAIIVEGAGSPAEINLREGDIANMGFAEATDCPVVLIADIDRGGVFAHLVGTLELLSPSEQARVVGFVINKFRGDISLLQSGLDWLTERTGKPVLGVLPYLMGLNLDAEDALPRGTANASEESANRQQLRIIVPAIPRISNHTDFDPLRQHPEVIFEFIGPGQPIPAADLIILPGSKNVRADLHWLREQGWETTILRHLRYGGKVMGICGGFQMLGQQIHDPLGVEGPIGSSAGLALLDIETTLAAEKQLRNVAGLLLPAQVPISGYEIHAGQSQGPALANPLIGYQQQTDGALSSDDQVLGTYLHGLFESPEACQWLLQWAGLSNPLTLDYAGLREASIERLADAVETHLDTETLLQVLGPNLLR